MFQPSPHTILFDNGVLPGVVVSCGDRRSPPLKLAAMYVCIVKLLGDEDTFWPHRTKNHQYFCCRNVKSVVHHRSVLFLKRCVPLASGHKVQEVGFHARSWVLSAGRKNGKVFPDCSAKAPETAMLLNRYGEFFYPGILACFGNWGLYNMVGTFLTGLHTRDTTVFLVLFIVCRALGKVLSRMTWGGARMKTVKHTRSGR